MVKVEKNINSKSVKETGTLKQRKRNRQKIAKITFDVVPEENIVLFDMRSKSTVTLKVFYRGGGLAVAFRVPTNIRICKERQ